MTSTKATKDSEKFKVDITGEHDKAGYHVKWAGNNSMHFYSGPVKEDVCVMPSLTGNQFELGFVDQKGNYVYEYTDEVIMTNARFKFDKAEKRAYVFGNLMRSLPKNMSTYKAWCGDVWPRFGDKLSTQGWLFAYGSGQSIFQIRAAPLLYMRLITVPYNGLVERKPYYQKMVEKGKDRDMETVYYKGFMICKAFGVASGEGFRDKDGIAGFNNYLSKVPASTKVPGMELTV